LKAIKREIVGFSPLDMIYQPMTAYLSASFISCRSAAGPSQRYLDLGVLICIGKIYITHVIRNALMMMDEVREILRSFVSLQFGIIPHQNSALPRGHHSVNGIQKESKSSSRVMQIKISPSLSSLLLGLLFPANYNKGGIP